MSLRRCWLAACIAIVALSRPALADLRYTTEKDGQETDLETITLRPNLTQPYFLLYHNPAGTSKRNVKIELEEVVVTGKVERFVKLASTTIEKVDARKSAPISFTVTNPPAPAAKDAKEGPPWPKLNGPPFKLRFLVTEDGIAKDPVIVPVIIRRPREYVNVPEGTYDPETGRLSFKISSKEPLDPPCPVELVLQPSAIPGLIPGAAGADKRSLNKDVREVEVSANGIQFEGGVPPQSGRIFINIDGYARAFSFKSTFAQGRLLELNSDPMRARIIAPRYSPPVKELPVTLEADAKSQHQIGEDLLQDSFIDVRFGGAGSGRFDDKRVLRGLRDQSVEFKSEGDVFLFRTSVRDHVVPLPTAGIKGGRYFVRMQILDATGNVMTIADEQNADDEKVGLFSAGPENRFAPLRFIKEDRAVEGDLVIDISPPEDLVIEGVPARVKTDDELKPVLKFKKRNIDTQSPIDEVFFFFGEADSTNKLPEGAKKLEAVFKPAVGGFVPKEEILVPADARSRTYLSAMVRTTTGGVATKKQAMIALPRGAKDDVPDVLTTITGIVVRGTLAQPDATVILSKKSPDKDDEAKQLKTKADGKFEFRDVEPGNYILSAGRISAGVARIPINVPKNKEKISDVKLNLRAP